MENKSNEPTKEFRDFFLMMTSAHGKLFSEVDLKVWWHELQYDSSDLKDALEQQRILEKTYKKLLSPTGGFYDDIEKSRFPTILMFKEARRQVLNKERLENPNKQLVIEDKKIRKVDMKKNINKLLSLFNKNGPSHTNQCDQESQIYENGIKGTISTDDHGRSVVEHQ